MNLRQRALEIATRKAERVVAGATEIIRDEIVDTMRRSSPAGHQDRDGYRSSAPGQPPAYGRGVYARAWQTRGPVLDIEKVTGEVFNDLVDPNTGQSVARTLEWGDYTVAARPHVRPAFDASRERIQKLIRDVSDGRA